MRRDRRQYRPAVTGLEDRQLMTVATPNFFASVKGSSGSLVSGLAQDGQGNLYGTTSTDGGGGTKAVGTVYELARGSKTVPTALAPPPPSVEVVP